MPRVITVGQNRVPARLRTTVEASALAGLLWWAPRIPALLLALAVTVAAAVVLVRSAAVWCLARPHTQPAQWQPLRLHDWRDERQDGQQYVEVRAAPAWIAVLRIRAAVTWTIVGVTVAMAGSALVQHLALTKRVPTSVWLGVAVGVAGMLPALAWLACRHLQRIGPQRVRLRLGQDTLTVSRGTFCHDTLEYTSSWKDIHELRWLRRGWPVQRKMLHLHLSQATHASRPVPDHLNQFGPPAERRLEIAVGALAIPPDTLIAVLEHYRSSPDDRTELTTGTVPPRLRSIP